MALDKQTIQKIKVTLEEKEQTLSKEIERLSQPVDMGDDVDSYDEETDEAEEFSTNLGKAEGLKPILEQVRDALRKIEKGEFGVCEKCEQAVSQEHLMANPETRYCQECKLAHVKEL